MRSKASDGDRVSPVGGSGSRWVHRGGSQRDIQGRGGWKRTAKQARAGAGYAQPPASVPDK